MRIQAIYVGGKNSPYRTPYLAFDNSCRTLLLQPKDFEILRRLYRTYQVRIYLHLQTPELRKSAERRPDGAAFTPVQDNIFG